MLNDTLISSTTTGTFETWVKMTAPNINYNGIMSTSGVGTDAGTANATVLRWNGAGRVVCEGLWNVAETGASPALNNEQWHHVAVVGDASTSKLYIDGSLNNTGTVGAGQTYIRRLMFEAEYSRTPGYFATVELDNSRMWSVARTAA